MGKEEICISPNGKGGNRKIGNPLEIEDI